MSKNKFIFLSSITALLVIAGCLGVYFLMPRYNISIAGEKNTTSKNEAGVKKISSTIDFNCDSLEKDGFHNCQQRALDIKIDTNQKIELFFNNSKVDIKEGMAQIKLPIEKIKSVVIRETSITKPISRKNTITLKSNNKEVLSYEVSTRTNFTENDLKSINQDPTAEKIKEAIAKISTVQDICINNEDNDANHKLGKPGQYYIKVNFKDSRSSDDGSFYDESTQSQRQGNTCEVGNSAGGSVEVFRTVEDAEGRDKLLKSMATGFFNSGTSIRVNKSVIRVSDEIKKASDQKALQDELLNVLTK